MEMLRRRGADFVAVSGRLSRRESNGLRAKMEEVTAM